MACDYRSLLHSGRSKIDMCLWILVISIPASSSTEGFSTNTKQPDNNVRTGPSEEAHSTNVDRVVFNSSRHRGLYLTTSFLWKPVALDSTPEQMSESFVSETKFHLTPSFRLLEENVPSQSFQNDINLNKNLSMATTTTLVEIEVFHKSNSNYNIHQLLKAKEERLALENIHNEVVTLGTNPAIDTHVNSTTAMAQLGTNAATNQLKTDASAEMYSATDFIPSSLSTTPQTEYATMSTVLDSIAPILSNDVSGTIRVSPSEPSEAFSSLSLNVSSSEQDYINTRLVTTTQIISNSVSLHPSDRSLSLLDNFSTHRTLPISSNGSTTDLDPSLTKSLAVTPVDSDIILTNTRTTLLPDNSDHIFSVRYTHETYHISGIATGSFVDISSGPEFTSHFELNTAVSSLAHMFSDLSIYPSGNYSDTTSNFSVPYLPFSSTAFDGTVNENAPSTSNWEATSLPSEPPHEQTGSVSSGLPANIVGSTVIVSAGFSSATGSFFQPQTADTKEWAVPVTACLSAALLVAVCVTVITCYRLKSGHADSRVKAHTTSSLW